MICSLLGSLSGCVSSPVELPTCEVERVSVEVQRPLRLPEMPSPVSGNDDTVSFDRDGFAALVAYTIAAGGNYEVAVANADALEAQSGAYNELIECSRLAHQFGQVREEQLAQERRDHFIDNWFHRGLIALGILVAVL